MYLPERTKLALPDATADALPDPDALPDADAPPLALAAMPEPTESQPFMMPIISADKVHSELDRYAVICAVASPERATAYKQLVVSSYSSKTVSEQEHKIC